MKQFCLIPPEAWRSGLKTCLVLSLLLLGGCASTQDPYSAGRTGPTDAVIKTARAGAITAGGYGVDRALGGDGKLGLVGGAAVAGVDYLVAGAREKDLVKRAKAEGFNEAMAMMQNEAWDLKAIEGKTAEPSANSQSKLRNVQVPSRTINGVTYPAQYQRVEVLPK